MKEPLLFLNNNSNICETGFGNNNDIPIIVAIEAMVYSERYHIVRLTALRHRGDAQGDSHITRATCEPLCSL